MYRIITLLAAVALAAPQAQAGSAQAGGYFRISARPDLQGGDGKLGYWNLYGRLLNEGSYAALEMKWDILEQQAGSKDVWTSLHAKVEGDSITGADANNGVLSSLRLSQVYAKAGNVLIDDVTWQVGTLDSYFGSLGLYDMWPTRIFYDTIGVSARYQTNNVDFLLGLGDSGYAKRGKEYDTIITPGGSVRFSLGDHVEIGTGGEFHYQNSVDGNKNGQYQTPGINYEDFIRGEIIERYEEENPNRLDYFPYPESRNASSFKAIGYLGFGGFGPIRWNNLYANFLKLHPDNYTTEWYNGEEYKVYVNDFTDERYQVNMGNELQLILVPHHLEAVWGVLYGNYWDKDNTIAPSDNNRKFISTVLRLQYFATETVHILAESSIAQEESTNGNMWREHSDSIFTNTDGSPHSRGLEYGDTDTRNTWQGKFGFVINPLGPGVYTRPSLRLLYGIQYSNQNNAFGNSFVESIDQYNEFGNVEQHWHHVLALETEVWF